MNPQDPLAALHPLREPQAIGWWPPAPGWWLLALVLLAALIALGIHVYRRHRANAYRRRALARLQALQAAYRAEGDSLRFVTGTNALLKAVALHAYPRHDVAAAHGTRWASLLEGSVPGGAGFDPRFADAVYRRRADDIDCARLGEAARLWIERHEVRT